mmetsp:Transcript_17215/g.25508  ORF Transcript_17215/g.25508 Transcript_17215/m.25508 type:complete len:276 (-) Transcript_17215:54-881(-)
MSEAKSDFDEVNKKILAISTNKLNELPSLSAEELQQKSSDNYLSILQSNKILDPEFEDLKIGWSRSQNGMLYIACDTKMENCSGKMLSWWFRFCDNTTKYKWWHPIDHLEGTWTKEYLEVAEKDRVDGHHIGQSHIVKEKINGKASDLKIDFKPSSHYFDTTLFEGANVTALVCARINVLDWMVGEAAIGHLSHLIIENGEDGGCLMKSRFWIGDIAKDDCNFLTKFIVKNVANSKAVRNIRMPASLATGILKHCREEMSCLASILPTLYSEYAT